MFCYHTAPFVWFVFRVGSLQFMLIMVKVKPFWGIFHKKKIDYYRLKALFMCNLKKKNSLRALQCGIK